MEFLEKISPREYQKAILETCIKKNCLVVLPTGLGKCIEYSQPILFSDGTLKKIGDYYEQEAKISQKIKETKNHIILKPISAKKVWSINEELKFEERKVIAIHKIKTISSLLKITTASGAEIIVTPEHPLLTINKKLEWKKAEKFKIGSYLAVPSSLPEPKKNRQINLLETFSNINKNLNCLVNMKEDVGIKSPMHIKDLIKLGLPLGELKKIIDSIYITGSRSNKTPIKPIWKMTGELAYFIGLITAEASVHGGVKFYNEDPSLLNIFRKLSRDLLGIKPKKIRGGLKISSTSFYFFIKNVFGLEQKQHSRNKIIHDTLMKTKNDYTKEFISGMYDGEGSVRKDGLIEFITASKDVANKMCYLLGRFGIKTRFSKKLSSATNSPKPIKREYYRIYLEGSKDLSLFEKNIGFKHHEKRGRLREYLSKQKKYNPNWNLIPINGQVIRGIREELGLSSTKWKDFEIPGIDTYERNERHFSHETLRKAIKGFKKRKTHKKRIKEKIMFLEKLLKSDIYWDKIKSISKIKEEWVYDVSVDKNCNFVAGINGGVIAHNTLIALMLSIERMKAFPGKKVVFLAPTKPLAEQHQSYFKNNLPELFGALELFTGEIPPEKRRELWDSADIVFSTPQCVANDVGKKLYGFEEVCLLIEDEAHRCIKNYSYNYLAKKYMETSKHPRILGLTASPGSETQKIKEICKNLAIEEVELRNRESPDVKPYLQELEFEKIILELPPKFQEIREALLQLFHKYVDELRHRKVLFGPATKTELIKLQKRLMLNISRGNKNFNTLLASSACAQAVKLQHALELLETQTQSGFNKYLKELVRRASSKESKGIVRLVSKPEFNFAFTTSEELLAKAHEHPKIEALRRIVEREFQKNAKAKVIVFSQFRETARILCKTLNVLNGIKAKVFVGQAKKEGTEGVSGLSQKEQKKIIREFSSREINVLCATSIGEEGLDLPEVNVVIFYEPVPSAIRAIQRAGRTARLMPGKLIMLITRKTRDEVYFYASRAKEKKMHSAIISIKETLSNKIKTEKQKTF